MITASEIGRKFQYEPQDPPQKTNVGVPICSDIGATNLIFKACTDVISVTTVISAWSPFQFHNTKLEREMGEWEMETNQSLMKTGFSNETVYSI